MKGFQIRRYQYKQKNKFINSIIDTVYPLSPGNNVRTLTTNDGGHYSSFYLNRTTPWKYFDSIRECIKYYRLYPKTAVVLGGGLCSVPRMLIQTYNCLHIDVLETNATIIALARRFALSDPTISSRIAIHTNAKTYMLQNKKVYDIIFVDIFYQEHYCPFITSPAFVQSLKRALSTEGMGFVNFGYLPILKKGAIVHVYKSVFKVFTLIRLKNSYVGIIGKYVPRSLECDELRV